VHVRDVHHAYGVNAVLKGVTTSIRRGERVAIIGANGIGKSTFLKILARKLDASNGEVEWGHETHVGYFAQDHSDVLEHPNATPLSLVWERCPLETTNFVRGHLGRMLFSREEVDKPVSALSGGEVARVIFGCLAVEKPNVLLLDEPTNHLDMETIEGLTKGLSEYEGTLIFVSHDRHFVSQLATRIIELRYNGISDYVGTYDEYLSYQGNDHLDVSAVAEQAKQERSRAASKQKVERRAEP
jgi:ATPase subunit of ABC transporter with duplicated ATPase domains